MNELLLGFQLFDGKEVTSSFLFLYSLQPTVHALPLCEKNNLPTKYIFMHIQVFFATSNG